MGSGAGEPVSGTATTFVPDAKEQEDGGSSCKVCAMKLQVEVFEVAKSLAWDLRSEMH